MPSIQLKKSPDPGVHPSALKDAAMPFPLIVLGSRKIDGPLTVPKMGTETEEVGVGGTGGGGEVGREGREGQNPYIDMNNTILRLKKR